MADAIKLLPCPFCGGPVKLEQPVDIPRHSDPNDWWGVTCRNTINRGGTCAVEIAPTRSKESAVARWNMRGGSLAASPPAREEAPAEGAGEQEIIARVVDPKAWADFDKALSEGLWSDGGTAVREAHRPYLAPSLKTASAILSLNRRDERAVWRVRNGDSWRYYDGPDAEAEARRGDAGADGGQVQSAVFS